MAQLIGVYVRSRRGFLTIWLAALIGMIAMIPGTYKSAYPNIEDLNALLTQMMSTPSMKAFFGPIPEPVSFGGLAQWEMGMFLLILGSVMSIMLAVRLTRASEEDGTAELIAASGFARTQPMVAAAVVVFGSCIALGVGVSAVMAINGAFISGISVAGSLLFGAVATLVTSTFAAVALLVAQFTTSARTSRSLALAALGIAYLLRALADVRDATWLLWCSPLGWRDLVGPYSTNRLWPILALMAIPILLVIAAFYHASQRDLAATSALFGRNAATTSKASATEIPAKATANTTEKPASGFGPIGLRLRLERSPLLWWSGGIIVYYSLLMSMSGDMVDMINSSPATVDLMTKVFGTASIDNVVALVFVDMMSTVAGILLACATVQIVVSVHGSENRGLLAHEFAAGNRRRAPFLISWGVGFFGIALATAIAAALGAVSASRGISGIGDEAWWSVIGLLPALFALASFAIFIAAVLPKFTWLAWIPVAYSGFMSYFGGLLSAPDWAVKLSVFAHNPQQLSNPTGPSWDFTGAAVLIALGVVCLAGTAIFADKRDATAG